MAWWCDDYGLILEQRLLDNELPTKHKPQDSGADIGAAAGEDEPGVLVVKHD